MTGADIALGTAQLGMAYGIANRRGMLDTAQAESILQAAIELGVLVWDTAPAYGCAESRIGEFLARTTRPQGLQLYTKVSRLPDSLPSGQVAEHVKQSIERSRVALGCDRISGVLLHDASDLHRHGEALVAALVECRHRGWVDRIGVSIYEVGEAQRLSAHPELDAVQFPFNVFCRDMPVATLRTRGCTTFARSALSQGAVLLDPAAVVAPFAPWVRRLQELCTEHGAPVLEASLRFALERSGAEHVLLGVEDPAQLREAVAIASGPVRTELHRAIEREIIGAADSADPRSWAAYQ